MAEFKFTGQAIVDAVKRMGGDLYLSTQLTMFDLMLGNDLMPDAAYSFVASRMRMSHNIHSLADLDNYRLLTPKMYLAEWRSGYRRS